MQQNFTKFLFFSIKKWPDIERVKDACHNPSFFFISGRCSPQIPHLLSRNEQLIGVYPGVC